MTNFKPTAEQQAIVEAYTSTTDNLLVNALAGASKTTTLELMARATPDTPILLLAFNKRVADEMKERMPNNCTAMTLNSIGHRAWGALTGRRLKLDTSKMRKLVRLWLEEHPEYIEDADEFYEGPYLDIMNEVRRIKHFGWLPEGPARQYGPFKAKPLMDDEEYFSRLEYDYEDWHLDLFRDIMEASVKLAWQGTIDFDDQILMTTVFPASFKSYPVVMIDEAQDLSSLNHAMLAKIVGRNRLIAVGDPFQAIYAFRGAHQQSMELLQQRFHMTELGLSISFRCPIAVTKAAQFRAPHMKWPEWAAQGRVASLDVYGVRDIPEHSVIICRNNAPLFSLAIRLLNAGVHVEIVGIDIAKRLSKLLATFGGSDMPQEEVLAAIENWTTAELAKSKTKYSEERKIDMADCLRSFAASTATLGEAIEKVTKVFEANGPLKLMTGHKAKGAEFHDVFLLDTHVMLNRIARAKENGEPVGQEENILYVMITRAMSNLTYIRSDGFVNK